MTKSFILSDGTPFPSKEKALVKYKAILDSKMGAGEIKGADKAAVLTLYTDYCVATNWPLKSLPVDCIRVRELRDNIATICFEVIFADGSTTRFSYEKAVKACCNVNQSRD